MSQGTGFAAGLAIGLLGVGAAYLMDPNSGRRRRALLRDQLSSTARDAQDFIGKATRDARQRARGLYEDSRSRFRDEHPDNRVLAERVRAELGRLSSHPRAIEVYSENGIIRLRGDVLEDEMGRIVRGVRHVRGVQQVINEMQPYEEAGTNSALQGNTQPRPPRFEYLQDNWSPAPRVLAGVAALGLVIAGLTRRDASGAAAAVAGAALLARCIGNVPLARLFGIDEHEEGLLVQKTIHVYADPDEVYSYWRDLESFPSFMSHIREVRRVDENRYHWTVDGPAGMPVEWDSEITADVPGELIAWRTVAGSPVRSSGVVQFEPTSVGGTRIHVRMAYRPPANLIGHSVAKILGRDPKRQIDADLLRFKTFIETGWTRPVTQTRH